MVYPVTRYPGTDESTWWTREDRTVPDIDSERIAQALNRARPDPSRAGQWRVWVGMCAGVADNLAADDPTFDREAFIAACNV